MTVIQNQTVSVVIIYFKRVKNDQSTETRFYFFNYETQKPQSPHLVRALYKIKIMYLLVVSLFPCGVFTASSSILLNRELT